MKQAVRDFFLKPSSGHLLAAVRIVIGTMMLLKALFLFPHLEDLFGQYGYLQAHLMDAVGGENFVSWLLKRGFTGRGFSFALHGFFIIHILSALFFAIGYKTKPANVVLWLTQSILFRLGWESVYGIDSYCQNIVFFLMWFDVTQHWALDTRGVAQVSFRAANTLGLRLLQIYFCLTYIDAGLSKAVGHDWWNEAIWEVLGLREFHHFDFFWMAWVPWLPKAMALSVLFFESLYFIGVWLPKVGKYWVVVVISMHIGIAVTMGLVLFGTTLALMNAALFLLPIRYREGRMKFFENEDFRYNESFKVQVLPFLDSHILFVRNIYKHPDRVSEYLHSLGAVKSHKVCAESKNGVDFLDGQHAVFVGDDSYRNELEIKIAEFFRTNAQPRPHLVFNQFRLLKPAPRGKHWWPHTDKKVNILTFMNEGHEGAGTGIYRQLREMGEDQNEHMHPWRTDEEYEQIYCIRDRFNSLVAFPGHWHHGMSIVDDTFVTKSRFTEICFI